MPAAISAPNTASSRISVIGTEVTSALRKSESSSAFAAALVLASPASATTRRGYRACTAATAAMSAADGGVGAGVRPGDPERDQGAVPVGGDQARDRRGASGETMSSAARGSRRSAVTTAWAACRIAGSSWNVTPAARAWISTLSDGGVITPEPVHHLLGLTGLAGVVLRPALRAEQLAGHEGRGHEQQPADDAALRCRALQHATRSTTGLRSRLPVCGVRGSVPWAGRATLSTGAFRGGGPYLTRVSGEE